MFASSLWLQRGSSEVCRLRLPHAVGASLSIGQNIVHVGLPNALPLSYPRFLADV